MAHVTSEQAAKDLEDFVKTLTPGEALEVIGNITTQIVDPESTTHRAIYGGAREDAIRSLGLCLVLVRECAVQLSHTVTPEAGTTRQAVQLLIRLTDAYLAERP